MSAADFSGPADRSARRWQRIEPDSGQSGEPEQRPPIESALPSPIKSEARSPQVERIAERLLEDERLRGDLTDAGYQPLLDWALAEIERVAANKPETMQSSEHADEFASALRLVVRDLVQAASAGDSKLAIDALEQLSEPPARAVVERLSQLRLGSDADENAHQLAAALRSDEAAGRTDQG